MSGKVFYTFSLNRRVYDKSDKSVGGRLIYAEHFQPIVVLSETDKEYICDRGTINKRSMKLAPRMGGKERLTVYTEQEREVDLWMHEHRYKLMRKVEWCKDVDTLKAIARLVGYQDNDTTVAPEPSDHKTGQQD